MKILIALLLLLSTGSLAVAQTAGFRDYRTLYLFAPDIQHDQYAALSEGLKAKHKEVTERDLVIYRVIHNRGYSPKGAPLPRKMVQDLRKKYEVADGDFVMVLVGKDTYEKMRWTNEIKPLEVIFDRIDSMPMRRREMRERGMDDDG